MDRPRNLWSAAILSALPLLMSFSTPLAADLRVDVNTMPRVLFTGDSQTCGRVGAIDYPQMLSWELPIRVINTAVGGTNTRHLLLETSGGTARVKKGEKVVRGTKVGWHAGPYPGQKMRIGRHHYTIDRIEVESYHERRVNIWLAEPAVEDFEGKDYAIEAGWRVRVAAQRPDYVCFMYSVNDTGHTSERFRENLAEIVRRTRALGAQPIFLTGVPLMDSDQGGSHPGHNPRVLVRVRDMTEFCVERKLPLGDVFSTMMALDEQCTGTWADTVHPTTDGSIAALTALRSIFRDLGVAANPYYARAYRPREPGALCGPDGDLAPITTCQPDYDASNRFNDNQFDLAAIKVRDEYALIAAADGEALQSDRPLLLELGIGDPDRISSAEAEVHVRSRQGKALLTWYDWDQGGYRELVAGNGRLVARLDRAMLAKAARDGAVWLGIVGEHEQGREARLELDYAAVAVDGAQPFEPRPKKKATTWPPSNYLKWAPGGNLLPNGNLAQADGDAPVGWQRQGDEARYVRTEVVARGEGQFVAQKRVDLFKSAGQQFRQTVRPLDLLEIADGPDNGTGRFIISQVIDDETVRVRRYPKEEATGLAFEIRRPSGCAVVPEACLVQCAGSSCWQSTVNALEPGAYRLGVFYRAYDPARMNARHRPGLAGAIVVLSTDPAKQLVESKLEMSFQWQRAWIDFALDVGSDVQIMAMPKSRTPVELTGLTLRKR